MPTRKLIFTICARNYYGLSQVLRASILRENPEAEFVCFVADGIPEAERHLFGNDAVDATVAIREAVGMAKLREMAFKYNLTEFCTAIKPFCFQHIFAEMACDRVVYLDPDVLVFSQLHEIFSLLESRSIVLTPHIVYASMQEGKRPDSGLMATGIFNLGFLGLARTEVSEEFLTWWGSRLLDQCFVDNHDALFTDQKWLDFVPALFPSASVEYFRNPGANMAPWNFHERQTVTESDGSFSVIRRNVKDRPRGQEPNQPTRHPLLFVHFSGFDYSKICDGKVAQHNIDGLPLEDVAPLIDRYVHEIQSLKHVVLKFLAIPYAFAQFENGKPILSFHRRLYRSALIAGIRIGDPFSAEPGSFFSMLEKSSLIVDKSEHVSFEKSSKKNLSGVGRKLSMFNRLMRAVKRIAGLKNYILLLRLMRPYSRPESQLHLLDQKYDQIL